MKLIYADVISSQNEPDPQTLDEKGKEIYIFQFKQITKVISKTGKTYHSETISRGKSKIKLNPGFQCLEIQDGVYEGRYWFNVIATHKTVGK